MKRLLLLVSFFAVVFTAQNVNAQSDRKLKTQPVNYGENVEEPFTAKELSMLKEVYQDKLEIYVLSKPNRVKDFKHLLRERIYILEHSVSKDLSVYKSFLDLPLFNTYNANLQKGFKDTISNFNPLIYQFPWHSNEDVTYWIKGTKYTITIKSQFQK